MSAAQGRFTGADEPLVDQHEGDPQSWNLYGYVRNNPLVYNDPSGQDCVYADTPDSTGVNVTIERGNCSKKGGSYVEGTVDIKSFAYNTLAGTLDYNFAGAGGGAGVASMALASGPTFGGTFINEMARRAEASKEMIAGVIETSAVAGAALGASGVLAAGELTTFGEISPSFVKPSPGQIAQMERALAQNGRAAVEKSLQSFEERVAEHIDKIKAAKDAGGYTSSMERELRNFRQMIEAAKHVLRR